MKNCLVTCCFLFMISVGHADSIKLATAGGFAPFTDESWKSQGMIVEILDQVMRVANFDADVEFHDGWGQLFSETQAGKYDATFPWYYSEERAENFYVSDALASTYILAYVSSTRTYSATSRMDFAGYRLCRPDGYFTHDLEDLLDHPGTELVLAQTLDDCFRMLDTGEVDVVPVDLFTAKEAIERVYPSEAKVQKLGVLFSRQSMHILIPRNHPRGAELNTRINSALATLEMRGILQAIRDNHTSLYLKQFR